MLHNPSFKSILETNLARLLSVNTRHKNYIYFIAIIKRTHCYWHTNDTKHQKVSLLPLTGSQTIARCTTIASKTWLIQREEITSLFFFHRFQNKTKSNSTGKIRKRTLTSGQKKLYKNLLPNLQTKLPISYIAPQKENPKNEWKLLTADDIVKQIILHKYNSLSNRTIPYTNKSNRFFSPAL